MIKEFQNLIQKAKDNLEAVGANVDEAREWEWTEDWEAGYLDGLEEGLKIVNEHNEKLGTIDDAKISLNN